MPISKPIAIARFKEEIFFLALIALSGVFLLLLLPQAASGRRFEFRCKEGLLPCYAPSGRLETCVPEGECCWGQCEGSDVCREYEECCPDQRQCEVDNGPGLPPDVYCVAKDECCRRSSDNTPGEDKCEDEVPPRCVVRGSGDCCEGYIACPDEKQTCIKEGEQCCPDEHYCKDRGPNGELICAQCCPEDKPCPKGGCICTYQPLTCPESQEGPCCPGEKSCTGECIPECESCFPSINKICRMVIEGKTICKEVSKEECCEEILGHCPIGTECLKGQCQRIYYDTDRNDDVSIPGAITWLDSFGKLHFQNQDECYAPEGYSGVLKTIKQYSVVKNEELGRYEINSRMTQCPGDTSCYVTAKDPRGNMIAVCGKWDCADPDCNSSDPNSCRGHLYQKNTAREWFTLANGEEIYANTDTDRCPGGNTINEIYCSGYSNGGKRLRIFSRSCPNNNRGCSNGACNP